MTGNSRTESATITPFRLYIRTLESTHLAPGPRYVCVQVDSAFMDVLARLSSFADHEFFSGDEIVSPIDWDGSRFAAPPVPITSWRLAVDTDTFVLLGRNGDFELARSRAISITGLSRWIHGHPTDSQPCDTGKIGGPSSFARVGPLLVHSPLTDDFLGMLERSCLEVMEATATLLEASMAERISSARSAGHAEPATRAPTARRSSRV